MTKKTGLSVIQQASGTVVFTTETYNRFSNVDGNRYKEHPMPSGRYALSHENPASGAAGRADFERDLLALMASENFSL